MAAYGLLLIKKRASEGQKHKFDTILTQWINHVLSKFRFPFKYFTTFHKTQICPYWNNMTPNYSHKLIKVCLGNITWWFCGTTSLRMRARAPGLSLPGHSGSAVKGVLVSWERELRPSPDAEALPRDSVLSPDWRKCSVRASEAGPGSLSAACTATGWETKSLGSLSEVQATCGIHLQQACEEWEKGKTWKTALWHIRMTERVT